MIWSDHLIFINCSYSHVASTQQQHCKVSPLWFSSPTNHIPESLTCYWPTDRGRRPEQKPQDCEQTFTPLDLTCHFILTVVTLRPICQRCCSQRCDIHPESALIFMASGDSDEFHFGTDPVYLSTIRTPPATRTMWVGVCRCAGLHQDKSYLRRKWNEFMDE